MKITLEQKDKLEINLAENRAEIIQTDFNGETERVWLDIERLPIVIDALQQCLEQMIDNREDELMVVRLAPRLARFSMTTPESDLMPTTKPRIK
jgi:hypothetical protein